MTVALIDTQVFKDYPDVQEYIDLHDSKNQCCLVTNCNDGFIVDLYEDYFIDAKVKDIVDVFH